MVAEERYWYPDDGGIVWVAGYQLVDPAGSYLGRDAPQVRERGLRVCAVAGARQHHGDVLETEELAPGRPLVLRRDPANPHDANAVAVDTPSGAQAGWVPRAVAEELAPALDAGERWSALVLREQRASPRDPRTGATMLLAPAAELELRVR